MATLIAGQRTMDLARRLFRQPFNPLTDKLVAESCALELLAHVVDNDGERGGAVFGGDRARIMRVCEYLEAHLEKEHHLPVLAREAGMSLSSFKTKFQAVTGKTVFGFLTEKRLERALRGMEQEGWSVAQAAWYTGYRHPTNFSSAFRRHFGFSPRDTKRQ
ncbi:helix-turn-helix transcriptional regulator [Neorhizobium sp. DT-125]|uniref:helix-turn-helix transcriptional regulator n=1 Tax=Neorhizobium sp. DT-125 TaxID=3396163 RepID=UPI003F1C385A